MKILNKIDYDFNIWQNTYDPNFINICAQSRIPEKWIRYQRVLDGKNKNSIIKPINKYVEELYPAPKLIKIDKNTVTLRQFSHADIFLLETGNVLKALDRPWMRQFYRSKRHQDDCQNCFDETFVAYVPWFIDENISINIVSVENSPFIVQNTKDSYQKIPNTTDFLQPIMVPFRFSRVGSHMETEKFGKIKRNTPIFDMVFTADDIIIKRVRDFYEKN